ncbi:MAG: murein biosynthesis integral membrane protein MurJ [Candidatus Babeliales bacterium]|nr:murein biosynthesis integral membrane protein MurJ [Candidatus Babeliales bacterium]
MNTILSKKSIIKKTLQVGGSTLISRALGFIRVSLLARYLPFGVVSDAFLTAFKIPNSLRKIFAEGALSAAFIPTIVTIVKTDNKQEANSLISLAFLIFEGFLLVFCILVFSFSDFIVSVTTPGFSPEQIALTAPLLKILIFFILFLSSSALLTGSLQSVSHFFVPAFAPVLLNVVFITALILGLVYNLPITFLCYAILFGGFLQFLLHIFMYFKLGFSFGKIDKQAWVNFKKVMLIFLPIFFSMSIMEINFFIDENLASYLPSGSISLIDYAWRFMGIPLGVFATALSTILLPHFANIRKHAPSRLSYYLLESTKLVIWVIVPATILMSFFADKIFMTLFMSKSFPIARMPEAQSIFIIFLSGLLFFSLNKILLNIYYSLSDSKIPMLVSIFATIMNYTLSKLLMPYFNASGVACATTISLGFLQTFFFFLFLFKKYKFTIYPKYLFTFIYRYLIQLICTLTLFFASYYLLFNLIQVYLPATLSNFFIDKIGFWFWVGPLCGLVFLFLYFTKKLFGVKLYFLD